MQQAAIWAVLAAISFVPATAFLVWTRNRERHGREPLSAVLGVFLHGATFGIAAALVLSLALAGLLGTRSALVTAIVVAPLAEEVAKGMGFGWVRRRVDELEDGLVYGIAVGLGFAATETFLYGLLELSETSLAGALAVVVARNVSSMLLHASSSAILGFGYARMRLLGGGLGSLVPAYLLAVALHAVYNALVLTLGWVGFVAAVVLVVGSVSGLLAGLRRLDRDPSPIA